MTGDQVTGDATYAGYPPVTVHHPAFFQTWKLLAEYVRTLRHNASEASVEAVRSRIKHDQPLDYDKMANAFAVAFLGPNFWKAVSALCATQPPSPRRVVDLGAGGAASGLAALAYAAAKGSESVSIEFVDCSSSQLQASKAAFEESLPALRDLHIAPNFVQQDAVDWVKGQRHWADLAIASHLFAELPTRACELASLFANSVAPDGELLIIERPDDDVADLVAAGATRAALPVDRHMAKASVPLEHHRNGQWGLQWISVGQPHITWLPSLVRSYFEAWRNRDPELLSTVFTADAIYSEKPLQAPFVGLEAIRRYWTETVTQQRDITATPTAIAYYGHRAIAEWSSEFRHDAVLCQLAGSMVLDADPALRKFNQFREAFRAVKYPIRKL
jgi:hypothetical protein